MNEEERWTMQGLDWDDPGCIHTAEELEAYITEVGFLPFFKNEIPGFSVEEHTASECWWSGDPQTDPWEWRGILAAGGKVTYGKFFHRSAGFISRDWFPAFANYRRDGYDFDALWEDELASHRAKKIMDLFAEELADRELFSTEAKQLAGYGKGGEKNFEGEITSLQMQTYLCIADFRRRKNKKGQEYGWGISVYCTPEHLWGRDFVTSLYREEPAASAERIFSRVRDLYPGASERDIRRILGIRRAGESAEKKILPYPDNLVKALRIEGLSADRMSEDQLLGLVVAVGQLREKQQRVLDLKYREGRTNEQIGQEMNRAAGTIGSYHTKAMGKLKWPEIAAWYREGYMATARALFTGGAQEAGRGKAGLSLPGKLYGEDGELRVEELCLRIGLHVKQFRSLMAVGIFTVEDLAAALQNPQWYAKVRGIGPKGAEDIRKKLLRDQKRGVR